MHVHTCACAGVGACRSPFNATTSALCTCKGSQGAHDGYVCVCALHVFSGSMGSSVTIAITSTSCLYVYEQSKETVQLIV